MKTIYFLSDEINVQVPWFLRTMQEVLHFICSHCPLHDLPLNENRTKPSLMDLKAYLKVSSLHIGNWEGAYI